MGEKIKNLSIAEFKGSGMEIELNKPSKIGGPRQIHIQNESFRFDLDEPEFLKLATAILVARRKLLKLKGDL